jgi:beta-galactosidase beta subunit
MRAKRIVLSLAMAVLAFAPSQAWDKTGHQAIAQIAAAHLSPAAKAAVADLLDAKDATSAMTEVAPWADEIRRGRGETAHWHFVDIPITSNGYDAARDCADDDCAIAQINKEIAVLKDKTLLKPVRAEALKFLIHFVGDIHQPLHAADNDDRGGNKVTVMVGAKKTNLHAVWDNAVIRAIGSEPEAIAALLSQKISPEVAAQWSTGTPEQWANESFMIAKTKIYPQFPGSGSTLTPIVLAESYPASVGPITATQLSKAGLRLAAVLNGVFGETPVTEQAGGSSVSGK